MSGSGGVSIARTAIRGENRFYNPPPMRRMQQEAQLQQRREKQRREEEEMMIEKERRTAAAMRKGVSESKNRTVSGSDECGSSECSDSGRVEPGFSNLDRFLEHTTPLVPARYLAKANTREHRIRESDCHPYFVLEDLWESFAEWSVYGAGVPLTLNRSDSVVQYYVPYLSAIQLYIDPAKPGQKPRRLSEDGDVESLRERRNNEESNNGRVEKLPRSDLRAKTQQRAMHLNACNLNRLSLRDESLAGSSSDQSEINDTTGQLIFEYLEYAPPFGREPLANKVSSLASRFPELMTFRSCDLLPSSWLSVAWYPIYRIPMGPTLQNLDACFLTYHSLSTPPQSANGVKEINHSGSSMKLPLATFGLASYKLKVSVWNPNGVEECQKVSSMLEAANKWLKRLQVDHPDYRFFMSHSPQIR